MKEKRKHRRVRISFPVRCETLQSRKPFYTVFKDISKGGLKIITEEFIGVNNLIKFEINLIDTLIRGKGRIAWCNSQPYSERYWAGIEFTDIDALAEKKLSNFLSNIIPS